MPFILGNVVPWGRSFDEYVRMFSLTENELASRILGCADGPASFNSEMYRRGVRVVSVDPLYQYSSDEIRDRIEATFSQVIEQTKANKNNYKWETIPSVEALGEIRMTAMKDFLADFPTGKEEGRYLAHSIPSLPFQNCQFDIALCSHFLFLYSEHLSLSFHCEAIREMCRVAQEVRVFPLLTLDGVQSSRVEGVCKFLTDSKYAFSIQAVNYEFQRGGNKMLSVTPTTLGPKLFR